MSKKEFKSTYERLIQEDPNFKKDLEVRYRKLLLSELIVAIMQEDQASVRRLAKSAKVSPSLLQDLKTGKKDNLTLRSFSNIIDALGYDLVLKKRTRRKSALVDMEKPKNTNYIYLRK